jgi:hypothetical protein
MNASGGIAKALLGALSLLLIGAVLGIAIDRHLGSARPNAGTPAAFHEMAMSDIARRLDLDSAQRRRPEHPGRDRRRGHSARGRRACSELAQPPVESRTAVESDRALPGAP